MFLQDRNMKPRENIVTISGNFSIKKNCNACQRSYSNAEQPKFQLSDASKHSHDEQAEILSKYKIQCVPDFLPSSRHGRVNFEILDQLLSQQNNDVLIECPELLIEYYDNEEQFVNLLRDGLLNKALGIFCNETIKLIRLYHNFVRGNRTLKRFSQIEASIHNVTLAEPPQFQQVHLFKEKYGILYVVYASRCLQHT